MLLVLGVVLVLLRAARLPVAHPVPVRGGEAAQPLRAAVRDLEPSQIVDVLPRDAIPAIDHPRFVSAASTGLRDADRVIGVELEGEARAYPVGTLSGHEIINDRIRGRPIAVTW